MRQALRQRHFRNFLISAVVSNAGTWMQSVAIPFVVYTLTDSKSWLGFSAFSSMFVAMLANTPGGILADRYERRVVLLCTQIVQLCSTVGLWALWVFGTPTIALIYPFLLVSAVCSGITMPAWQSMIPALVPVEDLPAAVRLNSMQFSAARAVGPALGALMLKGFGPAGCFLVNAVTYPVIIAVLLFMPTQLLQKRTVGDTGLRSAITNVADGWRYLLSRRNLVLPPMASFMNAAFGFGITTLAPALANEQFGHPSNDNGVLIGAFGLGGVIGIMMSSLFTARWKRSRQMEIALVVWVTAVIGMVSTHSFTVGFVAFIAAGFANGMAAAALNTALQLQVHDNFRGRVMGNYTQMFFLGGALGSLLLGVVADSIALWAAPVVSAVAFTAFLLFARRRFDGLRVLDANEPATTEP